MTESIRRKLVIVGDGACGKTCLLMYIPSSHPLPSLFQTANLRNIVSFPKEHSQKYNLLSLSLSLFPFPGCYRMVLILGLRAYGI